MRRFVLLVLCAYAFTDIIVRPADAAFSEATRSRSMYADGSLSSIFMPNADFELGFSRQQIEDIARQSYAGWSVETVSTEQRRDLILPESMAPYVYRLMLADRTERRVYNRNYSFRFTSPISGSEVYLISFDIKTRDKDSGLLSMQEWVGRVMALWGQPQGVLTKTDRLGVFYYFDNDGRLMPPGAMETCKPIVQDFARLEQKIPEKVEEIVRVIEKTGCSYGLENVVYLNADGNISRSVVSFTDYRRQAKDVSKRRHASVD